MVKLEEVIKTAKFSSQKHKAALGILYTSWWLKNSISQDLKKMGLTSEQFNVLRILKGMHPEKMCVKDIGSRMIEPNSNVPRIVDRLVAKKLVDRTTSAMDKRETVINLTSAGMNTLATASTKVDELLNETVGLTEEDAEALNELLERLRSK